MESLHSMPDHPNGVPSVTGFNTHNSRYREISSSLYFGGQASSNLHSLYSRQVPRERHQPQMAMFDCYLDDDENVKNYNTKQSRHLPSWAWYVIASVLGIRKRYRWMGLLFFTLTLLLALLFLVTFTWFTVLDVHSKSESNVLSGTMSVLIAFYWCALGVFANRLAKKLFRSRTFVDSVRMHSKRILKISGSLLLFILATIILTLNSYGIYQHYGGHGGRCANVTSSTSLPKEICPIMMVSRVTFSVFNVAWNLMVGMVMLSVCRTQTIGIRRFIKELEEDGKVYEQLFVQQCQLYSDQHGDLTRSGEHVRMLDDVDETREDYFDELDDHSRQDSMEEQLLDDDPMLDSDGIRRHAYQPHTQHVYNIHGIPPGTVRRRRRLFASRLSLRASQSSAGRSSHRASPYDHTTLATIHSQDDVSDAAAASRSGQGHHNAACDDDTKPLIDFEDSQRTDVTLTGADSGVQLANGTDPSLAGDRSGATSRAQQPTQAQPDLDDVATPAASAHPDDHDGRASAVTSQSAAGMDEAHQSMMLTNDEILLAYWKIQVRLCMSSLSLQRWLTMWVVFILVWQAVFLIELVQNEVQMEDIVQFVLTILIIPILLSAYGEVNYESKRMIRRICPAPWRLAMIFYLDQMPPQMQAYGAPVSYGAISTTVTALGLAFFTKMVLTDVNWTASWVH